MKTLNDPIKLLMEEIQLRVRDKDLTPSAAMGRKFYKVYREWYKLTKEEKAKTLIFGQP